MIRIYSTKQALSLRGTIPELAVIRSIQFQGDGYDPIDHGHIAVLEPGDDATQIEEIPNELFDADDLPACEYVDAFVEGDHLVYEVVFQIDDSKTIAVIVPDGLWIDPYLRALLNLAPAPKPLPQLERGSTSPDDCSQQR